MGSLAAEQPADYSPITEVPGILLNDAQLKRFAHRYSFGGELGAGGRVLEVACGSGTGVGFLSKQAQWYVGLDYTESLLHKARSHYGANVPLLCGDAQRLPFAAGTFDLLLCFEAIYYLADYRNFLADAKQILTANGSILIAWSNPDWPDFVPGPMSTHYPSGPELVASLEQTGFHKVRLYGTLPSSDHQTQQTLVNRLRRIVLRAKWLPLPNLMLDQLKRLFYGKLIPLPPELNAQTIGQLAPHLPLVPLPTDGVDTVHRVLYVCAEAKP